VGLVGGGMIVNGFFRGRLFEHDIAGRPEKFMMETKLKILNLKRCLKKADEMDVVYVEEALYCAMDTTKSDLCYVRGQKDFS
jgi:hypothetical protein